MAIETCHFVSSKYTVFIHASILIFLEITSEYDGALRFFFDKFSKVNKKSCQTIRYLFSFLIKEINNLQLSMANYTFI